MDLFRYRQGALWAEELPLARIAREVGTPTYVYSAGALRRAYRAMDEAFTGRRHLLCYSVKANSTLGVLALLVAEGSGFDIVSGGELFRVLEAGGSPGRIVFSGVGKTEEEIVYALRSGILMFNAESEEELALIARVGRRLRRRASVALRVNPDVDPRTHPHIATGLSQSKFGIPLAQAAALYRRYRRVAGVRFIGLDCHIGSQLTQLAPVREAVGRVATLGRTLIEEGLPLEYLDVGGGLGIRYLDELPPTAAEYAAAVTEAAGDLPVTIITEPGRVLVGSAGLLLSRALYRKRTDQRRFLVLDAGMNDLLRPALYEAVHEIRPVNRRGGRRTPVDVVGPVCESADAFTHGRALPAIEPGELVAVMNAGAYGMSMASNYNSRPRPAEVLVDGDRYAIIRVRETYADLIRGERPSPPNR